jgi:hypothetical protein
VIFPLYNPSIYRELRCHWPIICDVE